MLELGRLDGAFHRSDQPAERSPTRAPSQLVPELTILVKERRRLPDPDVGRD
jgi:hypothetical protein